jgi:predicted  nucleic acid-binding Zn-ribbon protein
MNAYLKQLVDLVEIDKTIDSFEPRIEQIRTNLDAKLNEQKELENKIEKHKEDIQDNELKKRKNELHLAELSDKLKSLSEKSGAVKTEKEMKALQLEEEIAKEQIDFANDEIERFDKIAELKTGEIEEFEKEIESMQEDIATVQKNTDKELDTLEKERMKVFEDKQTLMSNMSQNIIVFYEKIRRWAGNTTIVPVRKQACYGCYMRINDHTYASVIKSEEITTCPHCGRILFIEPQTEEEEATES